MQLVRAPKHNARRSLHRHSQPQRLNEGRMSIVAVRDRPECIFSKLSGGLCLERHVRKLKRHGLKLGERAAELFTLPRVLRGISYGILQ